MKQVRIIRDSDNGSLDNQGSTLFRFIADISHTVAVVVLVTVSMLLET